MFKSKYSLSLLFFITASYLIAQKNPSNSKPYSVSVRLQYAPAVINPMTFVDANAEEMLRQIFQPLISVDPITSEPVPVLAENLPLLETDSLGRLRMTFTIRPEAQWEYGRGVVARDVEFSIKATKCPLVDNTDKRNELSILKGIEMYNNNPRKFTLIFENYTYEVYDVIGNLFIIDPYTYDLSGYLTPYKIEQLDSAATITDYSLIDKRIAKFARYFNARDYESESLVGTGPYKLKKLGLSDDFILEKKKNWWGDILDGVNNYFVAKPSEIVYKVVEDEIEALRLAASGQLDVTGGLSPDAYLALKNDRQNKDKYHFIQPPSFAFEYLTFNTQSNILYDANVRKAISYLIDYETVISTGKKGLAAPVSSFVPPALTDLYNADIKNRFDVFEAKRLLELSGWKDVDGDGLRDKINADGSRGVLRLNYIYNNAHPQRKIVGEMLQKTCRELGIEVTVQGYEGSLVGRIVKSHSFDILAGGWWTGPTILDPSKVWSSEAFPDGYNYGAFSNQECDALCKQITYTLKRSEQAANVKKLQVLLDEQKPFIFLYAPEQPVVVNKKLKYPAAISLRPGYWAAGFELQE